ncbi:hypothetical protein SLNWT_0697 [Streptomyces albus]|uniref:Uncharacterized protein n=1 Tax=Streptomyces albus (strain ATCC 21838 / DSM 41398 / FERM P-419 / JCM 4703 / NBRC 107858) TaxID=1081613 RepID=A0A0B5EG84_STRA4|nr:hypothetical protein SLNWT_0697 [Streptomyces albus]AOU75386.1 hypothetical protein SLNHY_0695 [Streptomyces albus]AYN31190.1 hypothetical protein DUI70_0687 [Streptomyces albus]
MPGGAPHRPALPCARLSPAPSGWVPASPPPFPDTPRSRTPVVRSRSRGCGPRLLPCTPPAGGAGQDAFGVRDVPAGS